MPPPQKKKFNKLRQRKGRKDPPPSDDDDDEEENVVMVKATKKTAKKAAAASTEDEEEEEEEEWEDDDDDEEEEDDDDDKFAIVLHTGGSGGGTDALEEEYMEACEDDEVAECDSEDEQTFMKESYEKVTVVSKGTKITLPETAEAAEDAEDDADLKDVDAEYKELLDLKKLLAQKLARTPNSTHIKKSIDDCTETIRDLVRRARAKNAKKYYELVQDSAQQDMGEINYFKKKMSNQEQKRVMDQLQQVNDHMLIKKPYRLLLLESDIPPKYKAAVMQKVNVLKSMEPSNSEYYKLKTWVDAFMRIPFGIQKNLSVTIGDGIDKCHAFMESAKDTLDHCVYGLDDAKMQIMQMIGQWITNPAAMGTAIAIKGPPGTGKTSLVKEGISKILGREFAFIALGGTGDASFLEGHSYTYEGSLWGKVAQILMDSKCMNPVIYFDELDKVSETFRGEEIIGTLPVAARGRLR
jgi:ATP-dependent Lon protease